MKKILVIMAVVTLVILTAIGGNTGSGENRNPMEIVIVDWEMNENGNTKATNVDVVLSTEDACKELMEEYEWYEATANLGSMNGQRIMVSLMGRDPDDGWTYGELWVFPIDENGEPLRMDLTEFATELEVYYNL